MSLFDLSFSSYSINENKKPFEENDADSFINKYEHKQYEIPQEQDLFSPQSPSHCHEFLFQLEEEEEKSIHQSLENLTQSLFDYQNLIDDEKQLSEIIQPILHQNNEPTNKQVFNQLNIVQKETNNTSLTKVTPESTNSNGNKLLGRKRRGDKGKRVHSKETPDNQMRKVKSYYMKYINENVNSSLSPNHKKLLKITPYVNENLNINYNLDLMEKRIKKMYAENPINKRHSKKTTDKYYNRDLVEEIYDKNEETEAIRILDMTFFEYLDFMRKNDLNKFKQDLIQKEVKNGESQQEAIRYVNKLVELLMGYENWFKTKTPRTSRKGKKAKKK